MLDYENIWLGIYETKEEAITARFIGDVLLFKEFRYKNKDLEKIKIYKDLPDIKILNIEKNIKKFLNKRGISYSYNDFLQYINKTGDNNDV